MCQTYFFQNKKKNTTQNQITTFHVEGSVFNMLEGLKNVLSGIIEEICTANFRNSNITQCLVNF